MAFYPFKKNLILLGLLVIFSTLFYFPIKNFPPVSSVHAQESGYCESDFVFNGGDAGDEGNWEYVGSCDDYYHENSDDSEYLCDKAGGDWDGDRCRTSSSSDNPRDESCPTERWDDSQTSGEYYCRDGQACYKKWKQLNSCDIVEDGWNCQNVDANHECSNNRDESCPITPQHPECRADGLVYQTFKDCNGEWVDAKPTGDRCDGGGGSADDNEEKSGACPSNQYWDINTGQCQNPTDEQAAINDEIYCQEECGGQCAGQLGAKYCVNQDGSNRYDCSDPANLGRAECRNELINEFAIIGLEPESAEPPVAATPSNPANPCEVDPGSEYCQTQKSQADQAQSFQQNCENGGDGEYYQECNWETHSVRAVCKVSGNFETRDLGQQPGLCKADPSAGNRVYCSNISCGEGFHCEVSSSNVAECKPNYDSAGEPVVSSSSNQPKNQLITVLDAERNIRLEGHTLKYGPEGGAAKATSVCRELESDPSAQHNCLVDYYRNNPSEMEFTTPQVVQQDRDNTCRSQNGVNYYCDGNVCIEKSSGWDGSACVSVYKTVAQSSCNNSCSSDTPQSGQDIKLLSCLDETDPAKRAECNKENARIVQTGQRVDQSSLIKASLEIGDCSSLEGEAKKSCENKNEETRFLSRVLDYVQLENCSDKNGDEKSACDKRNTDAIKAGQVRLDLGIEDCSSLTGDKKTNCEFTNYQRDQITQAVISFKPEDCSIYQTEQEKTKCLENNQKGLSQAVSSSSPFVGLAEVGASCVYTEACPEGGKKACAGKVASDNGAPVCKYDPAVASCSACTTGALDLTNKENKCSEDGQTCLNAPGYACVSDAQCQARLAAAQQAAANAPIDPAKFFSQKFEEGATCLQPQICDLGGGAEGEQVCYGKGNAEGRCDLSQGGGVCSACQAKGTIKLNREASCNAENKCVGAPALSGCMNDDQCKPVEVVTQRTGTVRNPVGPGEVTINNQIFKIEEVCTTERRRVNDYMNYQDAAAASGDEGFALQQSQNVANSYEDYVVCAEKYIPTGRQAVATVVYYDRAVIQASDATNQLDATHLGASALTGGTDDIMVSQVNSSYQAKLEEQRRVLANLRQAEAALAQIGYNSQLSTILDRSTDAKLNDGARQQMAIEDQVLKAQQSLAAVAAARNNFNQNSIGNTADSEAVAQTYDEFEKAREKAQAEISQLAALRRESNTGLSQQMQNQLDNLPTRADEQFKDQKTVSETNQLSNLARQSNSPSVILATQNALADRVEETERRGNMQLAATLQRQAVQASFDGWLNVYASELSKPGADSEKGGTAKTQVQIQNLIDVAQISDPQVAKKMEQEYAALPNFVAALNLANEIKRETVGTFAGTVTQDNNSAFYSAIANAEEQVKSREDLANLVERTCTLSAQRCTSLQSALGVTNPNATPDQIADSVINTSQSDGARAANLLVEQSRLLPQLYQVERAGDTNNIEQISSLLGRSNQIKDELAQIDPNLALKAQAQVQDVIAQGKAQNQFDYAANTYANNKELLLAFDKANQNGIGGLNGADPVTEAEAAKARMQSAIDQMRSVNPEKADAMQNDFDLTKFKLESFERGNAMVNSDGCVIEACQGNGSSAQNICTGQVAESKSFNRICAAKNGVVNPGEAAQLELEVNRQTAIQGEIKATGEANTSLNALAKLTSDVTKYGNPFLGLAAVASEQALTNYQNGNLETSWNTARSIPSSIGGMISDWRARSVEGSIPVFTGTPEEQLACRDLWQNTRVQGAQQIQRGESSLGCTIDNRSAEEKGLQAAQIANNGGTVKDIFSSLEGVKADSELRQRTLQRAAEEAGVSLDTPMAYWTPTQRDKFYEKLKGLDNAGAVDVFDAIIFPTAALSEVQTAMDRCNKDWGKDLCQLDSNLASTYQGIAQADAPIYDQAIKNAKVLNPGIADVPQSDFAWVVDGISKQQRGGVIDLLTAGSVPTRDQFDSDDAYYRAITADLAEKGGTGLTREQLINRLLLDANRQGVTSADGSAMSREDIANAVDAYLAIGDFGRNVVNTSEAYQWQRAATTEFNWQLAQDVVGLATIAGPLEMLDPTNPIVELAIKGVTKSVSVPARAVTGVFDNVFERIGTNTAKNVLEDTAGYGLSRVESNAVAAFYDGRVAGKTVSQSIAELSPSQQLAFSQATDKIGTRLGLTETPDYLMGATVLDTILKPTVVRDEVAAQILKQTDVDTLASQMQVRINTNAYEGTSIPLVRDRVVNGQVDGLRLGQATDEENQAISRVLQASCPVSQAKESLALGNSRVLGVQRGEVLAASCPVGVSQVDTWSRLTPDEKDQIIKQAARELEIDRLVSQQKAQLIPSNGNQALIQLAEQSKAVSVGNTPTALDLALTSASKALPQIADVVVKMVDGTPLNVSDRRALELAGISESSLQKNIDPLNQTAKLKVASVVTADPKILAKADLETTLLNQGMTSNQASMLATSLQPLAPTPPAPAAQPGFMDKLADTWNTLTGRNSAPGSQGVPTTPTVANKSAITTNQAPAVETDGQFLNRISQHPDFENYSSSLGPDGRTQVITVQLKNEPAKTLDELRADPRFKQTNTTTANNTAAQPNPAQPQQPAAPQNSQGLFDRMQSLWDRLTGQNTPPVVVDSAQRAQQRVQAAAQYTQEKAILDQIQTEYEAALNTLEEAKRADEHIRAYQAGLNKKDQSSIDAANLRRSLTEKALADAQTEFDKKAAELGLQKAKTAEADILRGDLTSDELYKLRLQNVQEYEAAKKTIKTNEAALKTNGKLMKDLADAQKSYSQIYSDLFNGAKTPLYSEETQFLKNWDAYVKVLSDEGGDSTKQVVQDALANLVLGNTKLSAEGAEKLAAALKNIDSKINALNKAQQELVEARHIVDGYKARRDLIRQVAVDAKSEQVIITRQNKTTLPQIEDALRQQGITGRTEVQLYIDSNGELLLSRDAGTNTQDVIGIFNKSGDSVKLEKIIIPNTMAPKAGETASAVYSQLENIAPRRNIRFWQKNIEVEQERVSGTSRFQSRFDNATPVNIQAAAANPAPAAAAPTAPVAPPVGSTRITFDDLLEAPDTLTAAQIRYYDDLQFEKYFEDAHGVLFHSTDPADVTRIKSELGLPQNYSEADYFRQLEDLRNQRLQRAVELTPAEERGVRAALGSYLPRDVVPVSYPPEAVVNSVPAGFRPTSQGEFSTSPSRNISEEEALRGIERVFSRKTSNIPSSSFDLEQVLGPAYTTGRNGIYYEVIGDGNSSPPIYRKMYLKFADQSDFARFIDEFKKTDPRGTIITLKQESDYDEIVFYISYDPKNTTKADLDQIVGNVERLIDQANTGGGSKAEITGYGLYSEDPVGVLVVNNNGNIVASSLATSQGTGTASNDAFAAQVIYANLVDIARKYTSVPLVPVQAAQDIILDLYKTNPAAAAEMADMYRRVMAVSGRDPLIPNTNRLITIAVNPSDPSAVDGAVNLAAAYKRNGYEVRVIDQSNVNTAGGNSFTRQQFDDGGFKISDQSAWNSLQQKLQSVDTTPAQAAPSNPVQQVAAAVSTAVDNTADAIRAAGNGTPIQPVTDSTADAIGGISAVVDDMTRAVTGSPSRSEDLEASRVLNQRLSQLEAKETQLRRELSQREMDWDEAITEYDQVEIGSTEWNQLNQEFNELRVEFERINQEIFEVQNEWYRVMAELEETDIRINQSSYLDEVEDAINTPTGVMASRLEDFAGIARATGNTDLAKSLQNAAAVIRQSIQEFEGIQDLRRVLTSKEQEAIEYILSSHRIIKLNDGRRIILEWSEITDEEIKNALIAVGLNENADLTTSIRRVSQELNDPLAPIESNPAAGSMVNSLREVADSVDQVAEDWGISGAAQRVAGGLDAVADNLDNGFRTVTPDPAIVQKNRQTLLTLVPTAGFTAESSLLGFGPTTIRSKVLMWLDQAGVLHPINDQVPNSNYVVVSFIKNQNASIPIIEKISVIRGLGSTRIEALKGTNIPLRQIGGNKYWDEVYQAAADIVGERLRSTNRVVSPDTIKQAASELNLSYLADPITPRVRKKFGQPAVDPTTNRQQRIWNNPQAAPVGRQFGVDEIQADSIVGGRSYQEDRAAVPVITQDGRLGIFGVYDGHGGANSSQIAADNLARFVQGNLARGMKPEQALHHAYLQIDRMIFDQRLKDGSTGVTIMVLGNDLYSANAGDARAVMSRDGKAMRLSTDHKSSDPAEIARIRQENGRVAQDGYGDYRVLQEGRSGGGVAVARALGDHQFPGITAVPTINKVALGPKDEFTIIASDGFWDIFSDQQAVTRARQLLSNPNTTPYEVSSILAREAHINGSSDNITVQIIPLKNRNTNARFNALVQGQGTCQIGSLPTFSALAQANQSSNVLGISTQGEVLAASTGPCGPVSAVVKNIASNLPQQTQVDWVNQAKKIDRFMQRLGVRAVLTNLPTEEELEQFRLNDKQVNYQPIPQNVAPTQPIQALNLKAPENSGGTGDSYLIQLIRGTGGVIEGIRRKITGADGILSRAMISVNPDSDSLDLAVAAVKPQVEAARAARKSTDPEYVKRVNESLNQDRVNFLVFGYGEEHGDSYADFGGSISIISYDLKTGKQTSVSFTRDIRSPELEEMVVNPQTGEKESTGIVTLREVYKRKGLEGMKEIAERMTGLAVDYQIVMQDTVLKDYLSQVSGPIEVDISKQNVSGPFRIGGKEYPGGFIFEAGRQTLSPDDAIRYLIAENINPVGKIDDRAYRKSPVTEGIAKSTGNNILADYNQITASIASGNLTQAYNQVKNSTPVKIYDFYNNQTAMGTLLMSVDPVDQLQTGMINVASQVVDKGLEGLNLTDPYFINAVLNPVTTTTVLENRAQRIVNNIRDIGLTTPDKNNKTQVVVSAPGYGDSGVAGGLERLHQIWNNDQLFEGKPTTNSRVYTEAVAQNEKETKDKRGDSIGYVQIPFGGNPYSDDLINDYWKSVRCLTQYNLTGVECTNIAP